MSDPAEVAPDADAAGGKRKRAAPKQYDEAELPTKPKKTKAPSAASASSASSSAAATKAPGPALKIKLVAKPVEAELTPEEASLLERYKELRAIREAARRNPEAPAELESQNQEAKKAELIELLQKQMEETNEVEEPKNRASRARRVDLLSGA